MKSICCFVFHIVENHVSRMHNNQLIMSISTCSLEPQCLDMRSEARSVTFAISRTSRKSNRNSHATCASCIVNMHSEVWFFADHVTHRLTSNSGCRCGEYRRLCAIRPCDTVTPTGSSTMTLHLAVAIIAG